MTVWRYISRSKVKHALPHADALVAFCGASPAWFWPHWLGTGSQQEYETAAALRPCRRCLAKGYRP